MASSKLSLTFRIFRGDQLVREERLAQGVIKIGKVPSAHLRIDDESVSRMHAIVEVTGDEVVLIDLGSTRGTFVNGQKIHKARLHTGDSIQVGDSRVEVEIAAPAREEAPAPAVRPAPDVVAGTLPVASAAPAPRTPPPVPRATSAAVTLPAVPRAVSAAGTAPAPVFQVAPDEPDEPDGAPSGARAVEVAAMLGDSVVGVKHCMDPRGGKVSTATRAIAAGGLACLFASAVAFYVSVDNAARNQAALAHHTRELNRPAYSFRPHELGGLVDGLAFGGLALGLAAATLALVRARTERRSPYYRIGTAPGVEQPVEHAPSASFPLVAPSGDDFVFNYGAGIEGELIAGGTSTPLSELAATGRARPSATTPGAIELPIPAMARIRARAGQTTFLVSAVARPKPQATTLLAALEGRTLKYVAGSLATHLAIVLLLSQVAVADSGANVDLTSREDLSFLGKLTAPESAPKDPDDGERGEGMEDGAELPKPMALTEGVAGDPNAPKDNGELKVKGRDDQRQISRDEAIRQAREAGVLGSSMLRDISSLASDVDRTEGFDPESQWGAIAGGEGAGRGTFGMGVSGDGRGGGCLMPPCGIVMAGRYGTIPGGKFAGDGYKLGTSGNGDMRKHIALAPVFSPPTIHNDGLDKSIIKRHIRQRQSQISYCYEKELLARPGIAGEVKIHFLIGPAGNVQSSTGTGFDATVASCVAGVIGSIAFPATKSGSPVAVNYPFIFRTAGSK